MSTIINNIPRSSWYQSLKIPSLLWQALLILNVLITINTYNIDASLLSRRQVIVAYIFVMVIDFANNCIFTCQLVKISTHTLCISPILYFSDHPVDV
jgi:hypothetical protein